MNPFSNAYENYTYTHVCVYTGMHIQTGNGMHVYMSKVLIGAIGEFGWAFFVLLQLFRMCEIIFKFFYSGKRSKSVYATGLAETMSWCSKVGDGEPSLGTPLKPSVLWPGNQAGSLPWLCSLGRHFPILCLC